MASPGGSAGGSAGPSDFDPDYCHVLKPEPESKRATQNRVRAVIEKKFSEAISRKEAEVFSIEEALCENLSRMDALKAGLVANAFGGMPGECNFNDASSEDEPEIQLHGFTTPVPNLKTSSDQDITNTKNDETLPLKRSLDIVVGNVSKYAPAKGEDASTHKWMVYVRGPRDNPDISSYVKKVLFFLHPTYKPHDLLEVTEPPFHLARRGWGEFPVRVQVHLKGISQRKVDIIHLLKLDQARTGSQTLGQETVATIEVAPEDISDNYARQPNVTDSDLFVSTHGNDASSKGDKSNGTTTHVQTHIQGAKPNSLSKGKPQSSTNPVTVRISVKSEPMDESPSPRVTEACLPVANNSLDQCRPTLVKLEHLAAPLSGQNMVSRSHGSVSVPKVTPSQSHGTILLSKSQGLVNYQPLNGLNAPKSLRPPICPTGPRSLLKPSLVPTTGPRPVSVVTLKTMSKNGGSQSGSGNLFEKKTYLRCIDKTGKTILISPELLSVQHKKQVLQLNPHGLNGVQTKLPIRLGTPKPSVSVVNGTPVSIKVPCRDNHLSEIPNRDETAELINRLCQPVKEYQQATTSQTIQCFKSTEDLVKHMLNYYHLVHSSEGLHSGRAFHFQAASLAQFNSWPCGKKRAAEWQRARCVRKSLTALASTHTSISLSTWSTKQVALFARRFGYTPPDNDSKRPLLNVSLKPPLTSSATILEKDEGNLSVIQGDDDDVDIMSCCDAKEYLLQHKQQRIELPSFPPIEHLDTSPDSNVSVEDMLLGLSIRFSEHLLRCAYAVNRDPDHNVTVTSTDVVNALQEFQEYDFLQDQCMGN